MVSATAPLKAKRINCKVMEKDEPRHGQAPLADAEIEARFAALEDRLLEFEIQIGGAQAIIRMHQRLLCELPENVDSQTTLLLAVLWNLAQDPFSTSSWDKLRELLRAIKKA